MSERIQTYLFEDEDAAIQRISAIVERSPLLELAGQAKSLKAAHRVTESASNSKESLFLLDGSLISPNRSGVDGEIIRAYIEALGPESGWVIFSISSRAIPGVEVQLGKSFSQESLEKLVRRYFHRS